jgi:hypothetical protein
MDVKKVPCPFFNTPLVPRILSEPSKEGKPKLHQMPLAWQHFQVTGKLMTKARYPWCNTACGWQYV